jgi:hypothetical protein
MNYRIYKHLNPLSEHKVPIKKDISEHGNIHEINIFVTK